MHDVSFSSVIASLQHERINVQKQLSELQLENQVLRRQLYHMSTLLDIAVSKLGSMGVSFDSPVNIRSLRAEALKQASADAAQAIQRTGELSGLKGDPPLSTSQTTKKRFQLRTELRQHTKSVQCCAFGPNDEPHIVTGGLDRRLVVQNFLNGQKLWDIQAHEENISDVAWFQGTNQILSASYDSTVKVWDMERSTPDGSTLATPVYHHNSSGFVLSAIPLDKSFVFACADSRRRTYIVDTRTKKPIAWDHSSRVNSLAFDASKSHLIMGHSNGLLTVWDIRKASVVFSASGAGEETNVYGTTIPGSQVNSLQTLSMNMETPTTGYRTTQQQATPLLRPVLPEQQLSTPIQCISQILNDPSHANISFLAHYHSNDDSKRLISVSDDNMVRLYRCNLNASMATGRISDLYQLHNVLPGVPTRGSTVRCGFWKGTRVKAQVSTFLDDDAEKDVEQPEIRRVGECDLLVTGGPDNTAIVFDVTEEESAVVLDHLEGHRDRVTGATTHHSDNRPIIATTSADSTVRIWVPAKS